MRIQKDPIDLSELRDPPEEETSLAEACLDYLSIEHIDHITGLESHLSKHYQQRLRSGESLVVVIENVEESDDGAHFEITARIDYSSLPYDNPGRVLASLRQKDERNSATGSFLKAIPVDRRLNPQVDPDLNGLRKCPVFTLKKLDLNDDMETGTVKLDALIRYQSGGEFVYQNRQIEYGPEDKPNVISEGDPYILDPAPDDYTAESAYHVLKHPDYNGINQLLEDFIAGTADNTSGTFDPDRIEAFLEWMNRDDSDPHGPNEKQAEFIRDVNHELTLLQGPPGTGKTSGASAPAILARLLAHDEPGPCRTLVTGASNKAIDEVMEDVTELLSQYSDHPATGDELDDVMVVRAQQPPTDVDEDDEPSWDIAYTAFYGDEVEEQYIAKVKQRLKKGQTSFGESDPHIIVFATARRTWRVGKSVIDDFVLGPDSDVQPAGTEYERRDYELFDVIVADEASMMDMPTFLLAGTFYDRGGNVLLSGDHRQLPPVQQHDWSDEFSPSITELAPFLSVLNFCRLLNGEELTVLDDDIQDLINVTPDVPVTIPLHQLEKTYRCHERVADFLRDWVYWKLDNLEYRSGETDLLPPPVKSIPHGMEIALAPDHPMVVVTYSDESDQQSNMLEAQIASEIIQAVDLNEDAGIVTPHNAQRGLLERTLQQKSQQDLERTDIDTVERFQGGERDLILLSGTVSDPDYVAAESEFLLNLNRLNVAMSRMKKKLVVIASEAIFDHIPLDVDEYNQALLWKGLAEEAGLADESVTPDWMGPVTDFTGLTPSQLGDDVNADATVKVYFV